eukprot:1139371-Pelagomonas_calceolata.AAC.1
MPATKPDLSLKLKEKLEVYNCFCFAKKTEIYRKRRNCSNCSKNHARFMYSAMIPRIAMRYAFSNQRTACQDSNERDLQPDCSANQPVTGPRQPT